MITYLLNEKRQDIARLENKHEIKITLLPNPYMQFPNFIINKQKGDKKSQHRSYQGISKPQYNIAENGLTSKAEEPAINVNRPSSRIPKKEMSLFEKIKSALFGTKKAKPNKQRTNQNNRNKNRNKNRNRNRNRSQNKGQNKNQKPQQSSTAKQKPKTSSSTNKKD